MAAVALTFGVPDRSALATTRKRYTVTSSPCVVRIYCTSEVLLELVDGADGSASSTAYETIVAGVPASREIRRGEFCLSVASGTPTCEVTAEQIR